MADSTRIRLSKLEGTVDQMEAFKVTASDDALLDAASSVWKQAASARIDMIPAPLEMVEEVSAFLARSQGHGVVKRLDAAALHNSRTLALRLSWQSERNAEIRDLNQFVDGAAVLFPLAPGANAVTMGAAGEPVNGWFWRANRDLPHEVVAEGFGAVRRLAKGDGGGLAARATHGEGRWTVIFRRPMAGVHGQAPFTAGRKTGIAFAVWNGANAERSGRKSFSGDFVDFSVGK